ncbi:hypothetical protein [Streptomyces albus]|uniref:hypothetical protein n=1 Tax=Streptomyces albus TaxID=1888 RepID=UPI00055B5A74|nr:hypothetical protein [Streptomyces albus]GHJ23355.1 hypothetical protein TPA0909_49690 [Streptomyces albus]
MTFGEHTHGPNFGRTVEGCPRCDDLAAGAEPVTWSVRHPGHLTAAEIRAHDCRSSNCGPVCTFGDY